MEETNVSPPPTSVIEGDDLCETNVTTVAIHIVTLLICLCGLAGNGAVLCLLSLKIPNYGIFDLAAADFLFLLFAVPTTLLFLVEDISCSHIVPLLYLSFVFQLSVVSYYWGLFRLMLNSNVLYMDKLWKLCWHYCAFFALFTVILTVTFLCPSHEQELCCASLISVFTLILLLFVAPVVISSTVDFIKAKWGSQQQQPKRRDIVIVPTVLFTLLLSFCHFLQQLGYIAASSQAVFMLACIHRSIKPFICFLVGRCRRPFSVEALWLSLQSVFKEQKKNLTTAMIPPGTH